MHLISIIELVAQDQVYPEARQGHELPRCINELYNVFIEKTVSDGRTALLRAELESASSGQMRRARSGHCTVTEEDCWQTKRIHHGNEPTSLLEPVLPKEW